MNYKNLHLLPDLLQKISKLEKDIFDISLKTRYLKTGDRKKMISTLNDTQILSKDLKKILV